MEDQKFSFHKVPITPHLQTVTESLWIATEEKKNRPEVRRCSHDYGKLRSNLQEGTVKEAGIVILDRNRLPLTCFVQETFSRPNLNFSNLPSIEKCPDLRNQPSPQHSLYILPQWHILHCFIIICFHVCPFLRTMNNFSDFCLFPSHSLFMCLYQPKWYIIFNA